MFADRNPGWTFWVLWGALFSFFLFFILAQGYVYCFFFLERDEGSKREKHWCEREASISCIPYAPQVGDWNHDLGVYPGQESNPQTFGARDDAPTDWATQPGLDFWVLEKTVFLRIFDRNRVTFHLFPFLKHSTAPPPWGPMPWPPRTLDYLQYKPQCVLGGGLDVPPSPWRTLSICPLLT